MRILRRFLARLLNLTATPAQDDRLKEEIEGHIAMQTQENIRAGLSPVEARRRAILKFGGVEGIKQEYRARRGLPLVENFVQDVRFAIRGLRRTPGLTAFVVVTLALGIGMTSATFSMVDALIFRPYPVPHPGNIVTLVSTTRDTPFDAFSYREYRDIRDKTTSYDGVIAYTDMEAVGFSAQPGATSMCWAWCRGWGADFGRTKTRCPAAMRLWCWGRTSGGINSRATLRWSAGPFA